MLTEPTDAERATAREWIRTWRLPEDELESLAQLLATARAEGWKTGVEAAMELVNRHHDCEDDGGKRLTCSRVIAADLRALAGPGEREGT